MAILMVFLQRYEKKMKCKAFHFFLFTIYHLLFGEA